MYKRIQIDTRARMLIRKFGVFAPLSARFRAAECRARGNARECAAWQAVEDATGRILHDDPNAGGSGTPGDPE